MEKIFSLLKSSFLFSCLFLFELGISGPVSQATPKPSVNALDQKRIHSEYNEGNFELVLKTLEAFMAQNKSTSNSDSVFIAKHLAVVYSANPATREKGKYYMYRLLELLPSAKLVDMYVSDEIDRIFEKVREEFISRQASFGVDTLAMKVPKGAPATDPARQSTPKQTDQPRVAKEESNVGTLYWVAGSTAVVVASVATYLMLSVAEDPKEKIYDVP
jgi:hypothetical protein